MKKKLLLLALVLLVAATGAWWWRADHTPVTNELVLRGNIEIRQVELAFNASDRIAEVLVRVGDRVTRGQPLARLDTERLKLQLAQAESLAEAQRSQLARLKVGSWPEEIQQATVRRG